MKILVFGAGVLGSVYAARLQRSGQDVTILARGERLDQIRENGILLREQGQDEVAVTPVRVIDHLEPDELYDWILVILRRNQLEGALATLRANPASPNILFMFNNASGWTELADAVGSRRVVLGFPGAGGGREEGVVSYLIAPREGQPTTVGELDGRITPRLRQMCAIFEQAGFPAAISPNMDAWLKTHAVLVSPIANAVYMAGGSTHRLAETRDGLILLVRAIKEGLEALVAQGIPVTPRRYELLRWLPEPLLVAVLHKSLVSERAELGLARHANAARDEMHLLAVQVRALIAQSGLPAPAFEMLAGYLEPSAEPAEAGSAELALDWQPLIKAGITLGVGLLVLGRLCRRRKCCCCGKKKK
ncbi:ketopantoate reductase [Longilinea arvoryzae]|uniref:Ketopantoate reductase n=1 Tax=Longilinea arvoryzae TaxID=360412 RepID=A0A0K8MY69_9CHLR|nr:2-dehydropantoate 2-reductase N-terminal domain-containing protein [Longilinea arvoryzae]GAP15966.1 ketopantoate reductase [Longilinea arvoryzae]